MKIKTAAIQMTSIADKAANLEKSEALLLKAVKEGAGLIALPENFSFMGSDEEKLAEAENIEDGVSVLFLKDFAQKHRLWLLGGSIAIHAGEGKVYNSSLLINDNGDIAARYDKIHLFDVQIRGGESHMESRMVKRGESPVCADTPLGPAGLSVCYDLRFPELYRRLVSEGAKLLFVPAAFTYKTGLAHWEVLLRARAIENQCYLIAPAQTGMHSALRRTYGNSMIIDPWGKVLAKAGEEEEVIFAEIDTSYQDEIREGIPCLRHRIF
jgi:predicted amidohydrolase